MSASAAEGIHIERNDRRHLIDLMLIEAEKIADKPGELNSTQLSRSVGDKNRDNLHSVGGMSATNVQVTATSQQ